MASPARPSIPVCVQMYTLRDLCKTDFVGALAEVARIGYAGVELAGTFGLSAAELRGHLDRLGLKASSAHVGLADIRADVHKVAAYYAEAGVSHVVCPWMPPELRNPEGIRSVGQELSRAAEVMRAKGLGLCYHNHDFEIQKMGDKFALEILFDAAAGVEVELDLFWVKKGGQDPLEFARKFRGRLPLVHVKDMSTAGKFAAVGTGTIDFGPFFNEAASLGVKWYVVEQDQTYETPPLESISISYQNLRKLGVV